MKKCELSDKALENLREFNGDEGKIEISRSGHVSILYPDGGRNIVKPSSYFPGWNFCDGNTEYQAGYAYACGYHD